MDLRKLLQDYPNVSFIIASGALSMWASTPSPSMIATVLALSTLLFYSPILVNRHNKTRNIFLLWLCMTLAGSFGKLVPSLHALSSPGVSLLVLFGISGVTTAITIFIIILSTTITRKIQKIPTLSSQLLFPTLWATVWCGVAQVSPVGRLVSWSPMSATGLYEWILPFVGVIGIDWLVGAWAVVFSDAAGRWFIGDHRPEDDLLSSQSKPSESLFKSHGTFILAVFLTALTIPSVIISGLPIPVESSASTPLGVGCVLPPFRRYKHHSGVLDDYIAESRRLASSAKILLWPEGAVTFYNESERNAGIQRIQDELGMYHIHVGVAFEEVGSNPGDPTGRSSLRRTGLALLSNTSRTPVLTYYKRHLVPIAESYPLSHSSDPPALYTLQLPIPPNWKKADWAPESNNTRPIPLTASICLDFAMPTPFADLDSRPAIILAPARTWQRSVGLAMWEQAKRRANEVGSVVLWCDGGDGGVSGVAGNGYSEVFQVGEGSWTKTIGIEYPFNMNRLTLYARFGDWGFLLLSWFMLLGGFGQMLTRYGLFRRLYTGAGSSVRWLTDKVTRREAREPPNLIDY